MSDWVKLFRKIMVVILSSLVIFFILSGSALLLIRQWIFSKMGAYGRAQYEEWSSLPLHFNPADIESLPFQEATVRAAIKFREEWKRHKVQALEIAREYNKYLKGEDAGETKTVSMVEELPKLDPLIQSFKQLIERDDYEIDALIAGEDPKNMSGIPNSDYLQFQASMKVLGLKSHQLMNDGKTSEALNLAETMIKASKSHLYSTLICQMIAMAGHSMGTQTWHYVISCCNDPELLRYTLIRQNELAPRKGFILPKIDIMLSESIGMIRMAQKYGIISDIEGKSGREIYGEWFRAEAEFQENVVIPLISDPSEIEGIKNRISGYRMTSAEFGSEDSGMSSLKYRFISPVIGPLFCKVGVPNYFEFMTREKVALTKYDLLRLYTAKKLYFLEHQKEPEKMEDLVPDYIPKLLIDPFTKKEPFRKESFFYSIGPDDTDQKGAIPYDPTNGTVTPGDIYFVPIKQDKSTSGMNDNNRNIE